MRKRAVPHVFRDHAQTSGGHSAGERQVIPESGHYRFNEVPELWRKHARQPWRVVFPDLDWWPECVRDKMGHGKSPQQIQKEEAD